jgi:hypothetical protein
MNKEKKETAQGEKKITWSNPWEGRTRRFLPDSERVGRGKDGYPARWGWSGPFPGNLNKPQTFPTSSLPQIPLEKQYSKRFYFGSCRRGTFHLQYLLWVDKRQQTLCIKGNFFSYFFTLGIIWTQCIWVIV